MDEPQTEELSLWERFSRWFGGLFGLADAPKIEKKRDDPDLTTEVRPPPPPPPPPPTEDETEIEEVELPDPVTTDDAVVEPPAPPPPVPLEPRRSRFQLEPPEPIEQAAWGQRLRICMDFGTSASAVAWARDAMTQTLAVLSDGRDPHMLESFFAIPKPPKVQAELLDALNTRRTAASKAPLGVTEEPVLGPHARAALEDGDTRFVYYRSLKRLLSDGRSDNNAAIVLERALRFVIQELLLLALAPEHTGTLKYIEHDDMLRAEKAQKLGIPGFSLEGVGKAGIELFLSVPNAFGAFECEIIQQAATNALEQVLSQLRAIDGWPSRPPRWAPKIIREAEAVVWWEITRLAEQLQGEDDDEDVHLVKRWLVFDVGGGSTDAALVRVEIRGPRADVRTIRHSGVTFGGNDVDALMLKSVFESGVDEKAAWRAVGANSRLTLLSEYQVLKQIWAKKASGGVKTESGLDDAMKLWVGAAMDRGRKTATPTVNSTNLNFEVSGGQQCRFPVYQNRLADFLRATVGSVIDDLFAAGTSETIDRVVLSGRGALLPGLETALRHHLSARKLIAGDDAVVRATSRQNDGDNGMKLACVRGICAASRNRVPGLSHFVSHEITYKLGMLRAKRMWPHGLRLLPGGSARAVLHLTSDERGLPIELYQRRFPSSINGWLPNAAEWSQRLIGGTTLPQIRGSMDYLVDFDCATWKLEVWHLPKGGAPKSMGPMLDMDAPGRDNPVTGLSFRWGDE